MFKVHDRVTNQSWGDGTVVKIHTNMFESDVYPVEVKFDSLNESEYFSIEGIYDFRLTETNKDIVLSGYDLSKNLLNIDETNNINYYDIWSSNNWYDNIPKLGIICYHQVNNQSKAVLVVIFKYDPVNQMVYNSRGNSYELDTITPLTKQEILDLKGYFN